MIYELEHHISRRVYSLSDDDNIHVIKIQLRPSDIFDTAVAANLN
jgi:hypothetical protein